MTIEGFTHQELLELSWNKPVMAQIELTRNCNHNCVFCFQECNAETTHRDLSATQWKIIIDKLKRLGVTKLNFSGGENFLHRDFLNIIQYAKKMGFKLVINTNGSFSCHEIAGYVDEIVYSVHGLGKIHDAIVRTKDSFSVVSENILKGPSRVKISINMVLITLNYEQMNDVFDYFNARIPLYKFSPTFSVRSRFGNNHDNWALPISKDLLDDYKERLRKIPQEKLELKHGFQNLYFSGSTIYTSSSAIPLANCAGGKYKLVIEHDGAVYPCNFFREKAYYCGNILTDNEYKIWREGNGFVRFRMLALNEALPEKCIACVKRYKCLSGCKAWSTEYQKGGFENAKDIRCEPGNAFVGN